MNWLATLVSPDTPILDAIKRLDAASQQILLVVADDRRLLGTVTDGDIRRGILASIPLDKPVAKVMNAKPRVARASEARDACLQAMRIHQLHHMPIVDDQFQVVGMETIDDLLGTGTRENWVVLLAGGLGSRLRPLTDSTPKPLLKVGNQPLLQTIVENLIRFGFQRFFISVNYKREMVKDYFGDGSRWGAQISYLEERSRMGTAGSLGLLPARPTAPILVMNGDLLTTVNFDHLLRYHAGHQAVATMAVREYDFQVPFGVVDIENERVLGIKEKPVQRYFVNAGIYVLEPAALDFLPKRKYFDMPGLFERLVSRKQATSVFPVREFWLDIGRLDDLSLANQEFSKLFA